MAKKGRLFPDHIARKQMLKKMMQLEGIASVKTLKQKKKKKAWCISGTDNFNTTKAHRIMDRMM